MIRPSKFFVIVGLIILAIGHYVNDTAWALLLSSVSGLCVGLGVIFIIRPFCKPEYQPLVYVGSIEHVLRTEKVPLLTSGEVPLLLCSGTECDNIG